jgi:hypothetical protein
MHWKNIKNRFGWPSRAMMAVAAVVILFLNAQMHGGGFSGSRGVPFAWFRWYDFGPPFNHYYLFPFLGDLVVGMMCIAGIGLVMEMDCSSSFQVVNGAGRAGGRTSGRAAHHMEPSF